MKRYSLNPCVLTGSQPYPLPKASVGLVAVPNNPEYWTVSQLSDWMQTVRDKVASSLTSPVSDTMLESVFQSVWTARERRLDRLVERFYADVWNNHPLPEAVQREIGVTKQVQMLGGQRDPDFLYEAGILHQLITDPSIVEATVAPTLPAVEAGVVQPVLDSLSDPSTCEYEVMIHGLVVTVARRDKGEPLRITLPTLAGLLLEDPKPETFIGLVEQWERVLKAFVASGTDLYIETPISLSSRLCAGYKLPDGTEVICADQVSTSSYGFIGVGKLEGADKDFDRLWSYLSRDDGNGPGMIEMIGSRLSLDGLFKTIMSDGLIRPSRFSDSDEEPCPDYSLLCEQDGQWLAYRPDEAVPVLMVKTADPHFAERVVKDNWRPCFKLAIGLNN